MTKYVLFLFFVGQISFSQVSLSTYKYGYNGMELIVKKNAETIIISTYNAKKDIKEEIAEKVYQYFKDFVVNSGETISITSNKAKVTGKCFILKKGNLTSLNFHYEKIEWDSGLTELYKRI